MQRKIEPRSKNLPSLDDLYFKINLVRTRLEGLGALLSMASTDQKDPQSIEGALLGTGEIILSQCRELGKIGPAISEHALRRSKTAQLV